MRSASTAGPCVGDSPSSSSRVGARGRQWRRLLAILLAAGLLAWGAAPAWAAFSSLVRATSAFAAYTVPTPPNVRCSGLGLLTGTIVWDAVAPLPGDTVVYVVTRPDGRTVTQSATSFALPAISLIGTYRVQTRISSGWLSAAASINVTNIAGIYICG